MRKISIRFNLLILLITITGSLRAQINYELIDADVVVTDGMIESCSYDFSQNADGTNLTIPDNLGGQIITTIGGSVFKNKNLTEITLPTGLQNIKSLAFAYNKLTSVIIPDNVSVIGNSAFSANNLTSITIGSSVVSIGKSTFSSNSLNSLIIPVSVDTIEENAFYNNSLTTITIPQSVSYIGERAFNKNAITTINDKASNGIIYKPNDSTTIISYGGISKIIDFISESVTTIEKEAFSNNNLISVIIPNSVTYIGNHAFYENTITSVVISDSVTYIGDYAFYDNRLVSISIPKSITSINERAFSNNDLINVTIPNNVHSIGKDAFSVNNITTISIPNSVISIGDLAFSYNDLTSVTIPKSVTSIGARAFFKNSLTSVSLPQNVIGFKNEHWENGDGTVVININDFINSYSVKGDPIAFKVTFIDYDDSLIKEDSVQIGSSIIYPADPVRSESHVFTSWNLVFAANNNDVIAKAQYSVIYKITYNNVGILNNISNPTSYTIESQDIILLIPYDSIGYKFGGWFTDAAFTDTVSTPAIAKASTGDKIFYAKWETVSGISTILESNIAVYPNPTNGSLTIDFADVKVHSLIITSVSGEQVFKKTGLEIITTIDLSGLNKGIYILSIITDEKKISTRILKSN